MFDNLLRLKDDVGSDRPVDEEDTLALKRALKEIGRYKTPSYGDTPYPDAPMFKAIEEIQKEKKLIRDGIMKPGGETEDAINEELVYSNRYPGDGGNQGPRELDIPRRGNKYRDCQILQDEIDQVNRELKNNKPFDPVKGRRLRNQLVRAARELADCKFN